MPREGTKTRQSQTLTYIPCIEIRYAPGGGENSSMNTIPFSAFVLRLDMSREGTKTLLCEAYAQTPHY